MFPQNDRKKEERYQSLLILWHYFAANAPMNDHTVMNDEKYFTLLYFTLLYFTKSTLPLLPFSLRIDVLKSVTRMK